MIPRMSCGRFDLTPTKAEATAAQAKKTKQASKTEGAMEVDE